MEIYTRVNGQLPEYIRHTYPVFARFIEEYYRWLESRQLGKLENITDIDFLSRGVTIVENTSDLKDWVGFVIVDEVTGARAVVLGIEGNRLLVKYLTKDAQFVAGDRVHLRADPTNEVVKDTGIIDGVFTIPSVFIDHFSDLLDAYKIFGTDSDNIALILKNIKDFYLAKGTEEALRYLLKASLNVDSQVIYPWDNVLKPSDGHWRQRTAVTFRTIFREIPEEDFEVVRFLNVGIYEYVDQTVALIERQATEGILRIQFDLDPEAYEGQVVEVIDDNNNIVWAGEVIPAIGGIEVVNGGKGWQVGQVFRLGGSDNWWVESFAYDQPTRPWWKRNPGNYAADYGYDGSETHLVTGKNATICKVTVVGPEGELQHAEIIQLGEYMGPETDGNGFTINPLFFREGEDWEEDYNAYVKFYFNNSITLPGEWLDDKGQLSNQDIRLQDSYYYQQFSYDIISTVNSDYYQNLANAIHPAGTKMFTTYVMEADLDLQEYLDIFSSIPYVFISLFDIAIVTDFIAKHVRKPLYDTTGNVEFWVKKVTKACFDYVLMSDLKFKILFERQVKDVVLTGESIIDRVQKKYRDVVLTTEAIAQTSTRETKDYVLSGEFVTQDFNKPRTDETDLGVDVIGGTEYEYLAYDENHDPYYERVFDPVTYENLSYGPVGQRWGVSIHNENGNETTTTP